mmetsp:Transcript_4547/g.14233  ORF Transcript_4547/g.14233 Transcript_4547/m.14233 type:complete len:415 (-) Transcript_4547:1159-2403(-)
MYDTWLLSLLDLKQREGVAALVEGRGPRGRDALVALEEGADAALQDAGAVAVEDVGRREARARAAVHEAVDVALGVFERGAANVEGVPRGPEAQFLLGPLQRRRRRGHVVVVPREALSPPEVRRHASDFLGAAQRRRRLLFSRTTWGARELLGLELDGLGVGVDLGGDGLLLQRGHGGDSVEIGRAFLQDDNVVADRQFAQVFQRFQAQFVARLPRAPLVGDVLFCVLKFAFSLFQRPQFLLLCQQGTEALFVARRRRDLGVLGGVFGLLLETLQFESLAFGRLHFLFEISYGLLRGEGRFAQVASDFLQSQFLLAHQGRGPFQQRRGQAFSLGGVQRSGLADGAVLDSKRRPAPVVAHRGRHKPRVLGRQTLFHCLVVRRRDHQSARVRQGLQRRATHRRALRRVGSGTDLVE